MGAYGLGTATEMSWCEVGQILYEVKWGSYGLSSWQLSDGGNSGMKEKSNCVVYVKDTTLEDEDQEK